MSEPRITLALAHYDRHVPFFDGTATVEGVDLDVKIVPAVNPPERDGSFGHRRMLQDREFDVAEVSLSSYLMARERGAELTGIPVFPRRLFCQSLFFVLVDSPLQGPQDLVGRRVGINTYQTTLSVLAKGDLQHEYGVAFKDIIWVVNNPETLPFTPPVGVQIEQPAGDRGIADLLMARDIDAVLMPQPPRSLIANRRQVRHLFPDPRGAERAYYQKHGYWPIMHPMAMKASVARAYPWLPRAVFDAFERANERTREHYLDPNWSMLPWGPHELAEEELQLADDLWPNGIERNRANLERFMVYSREQGLISRSLGMEELFHESLLDT